MENLAFGRHILGAEKQRLCYSLWMRLSPRPLHLDPWTKTWRPIFAQRRLLHLLNVWKIYGCPGVTFCEGGSLIPWSPRIQVINPWNYSIYKPSGGHHMSSNRSPSLGYTWDFSNQFLLSTLINPRLISSKSFLQPLHQPPQPQCSFFAYVSTFKHSKVWLIQVNEL